MRAGRPSYPDQDALVIRWYTCRNNQGELPMERTVGKMMGSTLDWKRPKVTKQTCYRWQWKAFLQTCPQRRALNQTESLNEQVI